MYIYLFIAIVVFIAAWSIASYLAVSRIETPSYTIVKKETGYEIREYDSYIVAQTQVTGSLNEASSNGFRIIADYIFGNNANNDKISMTAPVVEQRSQKIAVAAPVIHTFEDSDTRTISFILPSKYTLKTLPKPNNSQVTIQEIPQHTVAALRFTWYPTASRIDRKKATLRTLLERDGQTIVDNVQVARYNPPLSMPFLLRSEILIPIEY
jgi:hypothetical protein